MEKQYLGNLFPADFSKVEGSLVADPNPKVVESEDEKKKREEADKTFRKQVKELGDTIEAGKKKVEEMGKTIEKGKQ